MMLMLKCEDEFPPHGHDQCLWKWMIRRASQEQEGSQLLSMNAQAEASFQWDKPERTENDQGKGQIQEK